MSESSKDIRLVAVVVTFNRLEQIKRTVARLAQSPCAVVVVDNGSNDGSRAWLAAQPGLHLVQTKTNLGGAGGFEAGMRFALENLSPDWLVLMDDDARPHKAALARFLAGDHRDCDAVAAAVYLPDGDICEMNRPSVNPFWHWRAFWRTAKGQGRRGFHLPDSAYRGDKTTLIDAASFVGLFVSAKAVARVGFPDPRLFIYGDDVLYTLGLRRAGGRIAFDPAIGFEHDFSSLPEGNLNPIWKVYYNYRNGLLVYRVAAGWLFWPLLPVILPKWFWVGRRYGIERKVFYRLLRRAIADGLVQNLEMTHPEVLALARR